MKFRIDRTAFAALAMSLPLFAYIKQQWPEQVLEIHVPAGFVVKAKSLSFEAVSNALHRFPGGHTILLPAGTQDWGKVQLLITNRVILQGKGPDKTVFHADSLWDGPQFKLMQSGTGIYGMSRMSVMGRGTPSFSSNRIVFGPE